MTLAQHRLVLASTSAVDQCWPDAICLLGMHFAAPNLSKICVNFDAINAPFQKLEAYKTSCYHSNILLSD